MAPWGTKLRGFGLILKSINMQNKKKILPKNHGFFVGSLGLEAKKSLGSGKEIILSALS